MFASVKLGINSGIGAQLQQLAFLLNLVEISGREYIHRPQFCKRSEVDFFSLLGLEKSFSYVDHEGVDIGDVLEVKVEDSVFIKDFDNYILSDEKIYNFFSSLKQHKYILLTFSDWSKCKIIRKTRSDLLSLNILRNKYKLAINVDKTHQELNHYVIHLRFGDVAVLKSQKGLISCWGNRECTNPRFIDSESEAFYEPIDIDKVEKLISRILKEIPNSRVSIISDGFARSILRVKKYQSSISLADEDIQQLESAYSNQWFNRFIGLSDKIDVIVGESESLLIDSIKRIQSAEVVIHGHGSFVPTILGALVLKEKQIRRYNLHNFDIDSLLKNELTYKKNEGKNLVIIKKALITGITGQDGSYLAEFLLEKGYEVHGIKRRSSLFNTQRVDHIYQDPHIEYARFKLHYGDLTDTSNLVRIISEVQPDEIYNLGAQSHVAVSFEAPEYTADVDAIGALRLLEAIRFLGLEKKTKFYQASTSELYGLVQEIPQKETTPFYPRSPYAVAKLYAYWITVNYREAYGIYACNGILFNHESPRRGETFVTRKITRGLANIAQGLESCLYMGNMDALRDWGHAKDYVRMQWMMLQQEKPEDFVIATGVQYSVREFITWSAKELGITLRFEGTGVDEVGIIEAIEGDNAPALKVGDVIVKVDPCYFRPAEVETLLGDPSRAKEKLGWTPEITVQQMCAEMVAEDLKVAKRHALLKEHGYDVPVSVE